MSVLQEKKEYTFNPGYVYGSIPLKMCIECEIDLDRDVLDE